MTVTDDDRAEPDGAEPRPWALGLEFIARDLGVSRDTARDMARDGDLPAFKVRSVWRVPAEAYDRWKADRARQAERRARYARGL